MLKSNSLSLPLYDSDVRYRIAEELPRYCKLIAKESVPPEDGGIKKGDGLSFLERPSPL
jgi:hypothetical protein